MIARYVTIDGMLSGTGVRNSVEGGDIPVDELSVSERTKERIREWVKRYERAHYAQFKDEADVDALDSEGLQLCELVEREIPGAKVEYFSSARMQKIARKMGP